MVASALVLFRGPPRLQRDGPYQPRHSRVNPDSGVHSPMCGNGGRISKRAEAEPGRVGKTWVDPPQAGGRGSRPVLAEPLAGGGGVMLGVLGGVVFLLVC